MSYHEKRSIIYLITIFIVYASFAWYVLQAYQGGTIDEENLFRFWGVVFLLLVPIQVVLIIVLHIVFSVINTIITNEEEPDFEDERDKLIELKSTKNSNATLFLGFLFSMGSQVIGLSPSMMFYLIFATLFTTQMVYTISSLYFYRRGF